MAQPKPPIVPTGKDLATQLNDAVSKAAQVRKDAIAAAQQAIPSPPAEPAKKPQGGR